MLNFKYFKAQEVLEDFELYERMKKIVKSHDLGYVLSCLTEEFDVNCYYDDDKMIGFSFMDILDKEHLAELCWFVMDKNQKGSNGKWCLDRTLDYCRSRGVKSVKFNCDLKSWGNIKDKEKLFKRFGYNLSQDDFYDMSIEL